MTKSGQEVSGTYSTSTDLGIGVSPGIVAFVNNYTAVEVSVGVLGVDFWQSTSVKKTRFILQIVLPVLQIFVLTYFLLA